MIGFTKPYKKQIASLEDSLSQRNKKILENEVYHKNVAATLHAEILVLKTKNADLQIQCELKDKTSDALRILVKGLKEANDTLKSKFNISCTDNKDLKAKLAIIEAEVLNDKAKKSATIVAKKNTPKKKKAAIKK